MEKQRNKQTQKSFFGLGHKGIQASEADERYILNNYHKTTYYILLYMFIDVWRYILVKAESNKNSKASVTAVPESACSTRLVSLKRTNILLGYLTVHSTKLLNFDRSRAVLLI